MGALASPWAMGLGGSLGLVDMEHMNEMLSALAARHGAEFTPLRTALGAALEVWPWPFLGVGGEGLSTTGKILSREELALSAFLLALTTKMRLELDVLGVRLRTKAALGGGWAWTTGLVEGNGWGWVFSLSLGGVLKFGGFELWLELGYRWAQAASLRTPREVLRPSTGAALDFSGPFGGVGLFWRP